MPLFRGYLPIDRVKEMLDLGDGCELIELAVDHDSGHVRLLATSPDVPPQSTLDAVLGPLPTYRHQHEVSRGWVPSGWVES